MTVGAFLVWLVLARKWHDSIAASSLRSEACGAGASHPWVSCGVLMVMGAVTAVIAVAGTLLGSALTYLFQRRSSQRTETFSFQQQLRSERMIVYSDFAEAVTASRRGQDNWWFRRNEDPNGRTAFDAKMEAYNLGTQAHHALFRVQLVADGRKLVEAARYAYRLTIELHRASTATELGECANAAVEALEDFIALASRDVQRHPASSGSMG